MVSLGSSWLFRSPTNSLPSGPNPKAAMWAWRDGGQFRATRDGADLADGALFELPVIPVGGAEVELAPSSLGQVKVRLVQGNGFLGAEGGEVEAGVERDQ
jgi:hypothetical protein